VKIFLTATTDDYLRLRWSLFKKSLLDVLTGQRPNAVGLFRGRLINSRDQLTDADDLDSYRCLQTKAAGITFPICVYEDSQDIWVSRSVIGGGYWEHNYVEKLVGLLRRYPDLEFVDLGANIGTFTLPAARVTHVVAVEPYSRSMGRLLKSVQTGGVTKNVSLVYNAISNRRSAYTLGFGLDNVGGTFLKTHAAVSPTNNCRGGACTRTILLYDLLPLMRGRRALMKVSNRKLSKKINKLTKC